MRLSRKSIGYLLGSTALAIALHQPAAVQVMSCPNPNPQPAHELALDSEYVLHRLFMPKHFQA